MAYNSWGGSWGTSWASTWTGDFVPTPSELPVVLPGGVRQARYLRRAPKLPWDVEEEAPVVTVTENPRRKRIKLPREVIETVQDAIPVQAYVEIPLPQVIIPDVPVQRTDDDDDLLLMI